MQDIIFPRCRFMLQPPFVSLFAFVWLQLKDTIWGSVVQHFLGWYISSCSHTLMVVLLMGNKTMNTVNNHCSVHWYKYNCTFCLALGYKLIVHFLVILTSYWARYLDHCQLQDIIRTVNLWVAIDLWCSSMAHTLQNHQSYFKEYSWLQGQFESISPFILSLHQLTMWVGEFYA